MIMTTKKMISLALTLAMTLCFAGCSDTTSATPSPSSATTAPDPSSTTEAATPEPSSEPTEIPPSDASQSSYTPSDDSLYAIEYEDKAGGWVPSGPWEGQTSANEEPIDPWSVAPSKPTFRDSQMQTGDYPGPGWGWMNYGDFYDAMLARNSNYIFQGTREELLWPGFEGSGRGFLAWNNGVISVGVFIHTTPAEIGFRNLEAIVIEAWYTYEETDERVVCYTTDDHMALGDRNGFAPFFGEKLWDTLALADKATTIKEMEAIRDWLAE